MGRGPTLPPGPARPPTLAQSDYCEYLSFGVRSGSEISSEGAHPIYTASMVLFSCINAFFIVSTPGGWRMAHGVGFLLAGASAFSGACLARPAPTAHAHCHHPAVPTPPPTPHNEPAGRRVREPADGGGARLPPRLQRPPAAGVQPARSVVSLPLCSFVCGQRGCRAWCPHVCGGGICPSLCVLVVACSLGPDCCPGPAAACTTHAPGWLWMWLPASPSTASWRWHPRAPTFTTSAT